MAIGRRNTEWPADRQLIKKDGHEVLWLYRRVDDFGAALTARRCERGVWLRPSRLCACTAHRVAGCNCTMCCVQ